jgi:dTDP-4-dehydrorhamnose reductase
VQRLRSVLIVGGSGFVGSQLALRFREHFKVFATYYFNRISIPGVTCLPLDALKKDTVKRIAYTTEPDIIIYCAGKEDVSWAEERPKDADRIHTAGAVSVLTNSDILQPKFIYLSNSYVFDGRRGNYHEKDVVLPNANLGRTKLSSENYVKGRSLNHVIIRSTPLIGYGCGTNYSFIDRLRFALASGRMVKLDHNEYHSFAPISGFLELMTQICMSGVRNRILHFGGLTRMTYFELGRAFARRFGYDPNLVQIKLRYRNEVIERPEYDYSLNCTQTMETLKIKPLLLEQTLDLLDQHLTP